MFNKDKITSRFDSAWNTICTEKMLAMNVYANTEYMWNYFNEKVTFRNTHFKSPKCYTDRIAKQMH